MSEPTNSLSGFREEEIDGEPFHIFKFFSDEAAINSGGNNLPLPQPLFMCQSYRFRVYDEILPVDVYPPFIDKRRGDEQFKFLIGSEIYDHPCKLPLVSCNKEINSGKFRCGVCENSMLGTNYFLCVTCDERYHKECIECPLEFKHPSFPFLSLKLYYCPPNKFGKLSCLFCQKDIYEMFYYCPTYKITLHLMCAMKPIPILIDQPKRHPHLLTFFPKQNSLPCDVCGLIKELMPTYVCARCVFVVHQDCVYFPYVIKISRHLHRISFTYSLPSGNWSCGVCRRKVDNNYGAYSCKKCDGYFVHTRCALRKDLWDGKELEGVPEEPEEVVEPPFKRISDGIILHFSHDHHLKLQISGVYDRGKVCQACVLPIYEGNYYACMDECDFILHEACVNVPRKIHHALDAHLLTLKLVTNECNYGLGYFECTACRRNSCGFVYEDPMGVQFGLQLDLRCASVSEPFKYEDHEHPLYLALTPEEEESAICQICQEKDDEINFSKKLTCIECGYIICFACATLPYKARYKHDKHFLTFRKKEKGNDRSGWCEVCEKTIVYSRKGGFYSCDDYCSTTLHVDCLVGKDMYMKPGQTIEYYGKVEILHNKTMSRPICHGSKHRCQDRAVFKKEKMTFCSLLCSFEFKG